jgi:phospho-N-acetylmuramoyl-pentapeptide-transferase
MGSRKRREKAKVLYHLFLPWANEYGVFNLFRYLTFRAGGAVLTALLVSFWLGPKVIARLKAAQKEGQPIRSDGPESHALTKKGTPTMGGILILVALGVATLLWADLTNGFVWAVLVVTVGFGAIGALDDYLKLTRRNSKGLPGKGKILGQFLIGGVAIFWIMALHRPPLATALAIPFFKNILLDFGWLFFLVGMVVVIGSSNAVNLTDGLDGLAIVPVMIAAGCFALISYLVGNQLFSSYLQIHFVPGSGELTIICAALVGAGLGFLWFNAPPAMVFMGDTGSLAMGGALGSISLVTKHELVLAIIGGVFVVETISVIVQVAYFKATGKRIFLMAPIHHHFEKKGWAEPTIVIRFWIIATIFALVGLSTLKLR